MVMLVTFMSREYPFNVKGAGHCISCRCSQELVGHPFWQVKLPTIAMPPEPMFDAFVAKYNLAPSGPEEQMLSSTVSISRVKVEQPHAFV